MEIIQILNLRYVKKSIVRSVSWLTAVCFNGGWVTLNIKVVTGGHLDIDVRLYSPDSSMIFEVSGLHLKIKFIKCFFIQREKSQKDDFNFLSAVNGLYKLCFSNKMSTISHKVSSNSFKHSIYTYNVQYEF